MSICIPITIALDGIENVTLDRHVHDDTVWAYYMSEKGKTLFPEKMTVLGHWKPEIVE